MISLNIILIHVLCTFLEDFYRHSLSLASLMINQRLGRKRFRLCIEKEEQNDSCDSYQIDKQWTNVRAYPIKCKDELEALKYFTEGWN